MAGQPSNIEPYVQPANPVTRDPLEQNTTAQRSHEPAGTRHATGGTQSQQDGTPSALGYGVHGSAPVDSNEVPEKDDKVQNPNVNAEQLATLSEGKVADAVARKSGTQQAPGSGPAEEQDFASDLDRKKAEQAAAREEIKQERKEGVDVDGGAAGRRALGNETLAEA